MANTIGTPTVTRGLHKNLNGAFSEVITASAAISDQDAVAANDTTTFSMTVAGAAVGDMCAVAIDNDLSDGTDQCAVTATVTAANTVGVRVHADVGEYAADDLNNATVKVLLMRPAW